MIYERRVPKQNGRKLEDAFSVSTSLSINSLQATITPLHLAMGAKLIRWLFINRLIRPKIETEPTLI